MKQKTTRVFLIALIVLLVCSVVNWGMISGWGDVKIKQLELIGDQGRTYTATMYTPKNATNDTPAPLLMTFHGATGNARNQEAWAMEFARRGFVVVATDNRGAGDGDSSGGNDVAVHELFTRYAVDLPIVDKERIVFAGHSGGAGNAANLGPNYYASVIIEAGMCGGLKNPDWKGDLLCIVGTGDRNISNEIDRFPNYFQEMRGIENAELDVMYGSFEEGNASIYITLPGVLHEGLLFDTPTITAMLDFTMDALGHENIPNYIPAEDMAWQGSHYVGGIGLFVLLACMLSLALLLIESVPFFSTIQQPMPRNIGLRGVGLAISIVAAIAFPLLCMKTGTFGMRTMLGDAEFALFPMEKGNRAFALVVGIGLCGLVMLAVFALTDGKKHKAKLCDYGLTVEGSNKLDWTLIGKAFLVAFIVLAATFGYLKLQKDVFGTDFICLFWGIRPLIISKFRHYIPYIIIWVICFLIASIGMNVERRLPSTGNDTKDFIIAVVFNTFISMIVVTVMVVIQCVVQSINNPPANQMTDWMIDLCRLWGMPFGMMYAGIGQTVLYRKTGNVWVGTFLMGIYCALCCMLFAQYKMPL